VSTRHGHLAAETQEKIASKLDRLSRFHDRISSVDVTVDLEHIELPAVEVCVSVDGWSDVLSRASGPHLLGAVDGAVHKLEERLRRHKEKIIDQHRTARRRKHASQGQPVDQDVEAS
jgi:ribosomal subunit interface protein